MQGPGLYAAIDPSSSRVFGRDNPLLFAVPIRKGARILRLTGDVSSTDYDRVKAIAKSLDCLPSERQFDGLEDVTRIFRGSDNPICRQIIIEAYQQLEIDAILYKYEADNYERDCRLRTDAFNIVSTEAVDLNKLSLFWDQGKIANQTTARFVSSAYKSAKSSFYRRYLIALGDPNYGMPNSLSDLKTFDRAAHSWKKKNLLRCGGDWSVENQSDIERKLNSSIQAWFTDEETKAAIIAWIKVARAKINPDLGGPSAVQHISEIERAMFAFAIPNTPIKSQEFINWMLASDLQYSWQLNASEKEVQMAKLLNEQAPFDRTMQRDQKFEELLKSLPAAMVASSDFSRSLMLAAGLGPKLTAIKINSMIAFAGGSPMIINGSLADNKREFLKIVRRCTEMMGAPGVTKEDIQSSPCSVRIPIN